LAVACAQTEPTPTPTRTPVPTTTPSPTPGPVDTGVAGGAPAAVVFPVRVLLANGAPHATANVRVADLLGDGSNQVFATEPMRGQVTWLRGPEDAVALSQGLSEPVRTHVVDMDNDGDRDILVADIGTLFQSDAKVGRVMLLRNNGSNEFETQVLLKDVGRVVCAEGVDLDGDADMDIVVCVFGHTTGKVMWLEQREGFTFEEHVLDPRSGSIHAFPFDADADGDMDLAVSLSQIFEEILLFRNDGSGVFAREVLFDSKEEYYDMSGLEPVDLDKDGDTDILFHNGDTLDWFVYPDDIDPNDWHGLSWLENDGAGNFALHDIVRIWGAYSVAAADLDADSDLDLVLSMLQVPDLFPNSRTQSLLWLENDGEQNFTRRDLQIDMPPLLISIDVADTDRDGVPEIFAGTMDYGGGDGGHRLVEFNIPVGP